MESYHLSYGDMMSIRTSTGVTLYPLVYRMEAVLPVEVEIPSLHVLAVYEVSEFD